MNVRALPKKKRHLTGESKSDETALSAVATGPLQLKRILVPTDFSACSRKAFDYAASLAKQFAAEILLLHVVERIRPPPVADLLLRESVDAEIREDAAKRMSEWRDDVQGISVNDTVRTGTPYHEIIEAAEKLNADLIIIGTRGHSKLAQMLIGSTTERVVRHAPCPVLVVREREHDFLPSDGSVANESST